MSRRWINRKEWLIAISLDEIDMPWTVKPSGANNSVQLPTLSTTSTLSVGGGGSICSNNMSKGN
jgi:hypothetical protein